MCVSTRTKKKVKKKDIESGLDFPTTRFAHIEKFSLNFSSWSFVIRVNLLHP